MVDEKEILNPQAEGSNATAGSSSFSTVIEEITDSEEEILSSDYDSDFDYSSDEEWNKKFNEFEKILDELTKRKKEWEIFKKKIDNLKERGEKTNNQKELQKLETERLKLIQEYKELVELVSRKVQLEKELNFSDREDESENEEGKSKDKGKGKEVVNKKELELAKLETSLVSWINEGKEQEEAKIEIKGINKGGAAVVGTATGGGMAAAFAMAGAEIGTAVFPVVGTVAGGVIGGVLGGVTTGITTATLLIRNDEKRIRKQTKEQLENIVLDLTKRQQEEKNNLIRYLTIVKEKMTENENANKELIRQINQLRKEKESKEQEDAEEKARIDKAKGENQKALQSTEKSEIEQLEAERNQLRATSEEQEAFLNRWIREYNRLELEKQNTVLAMEELFLKFKQRGRNITALSGDNEGLKEAKKNLTKERNTARTERDTAREELGKLKLVKIQLEHDKKKAEEAKAEAERTVESLGYPKWFKRSTDFLGVESANQIWGKGVFLGRFALLLLVGAILFYITSWVLRILVGIGKNLKVIFTKKQDTATVLREMLSGMKEAKDGVIKKVKRVKKAPAEEVKEVEVIEEETKEPQEGEKPVKKGKNREKRKKQKKGKK